MRTGYKRAQAPSSEEINELLCRDLSSKFLNKKKHSRNKKNSTYVEKLLFLHFDDFRLLVVQL